MKMVLGTELSASDRKHVLAAYVHRHTGEHKPAWATSSHWRFDGTTATPWPIQFKDDAEWLANTTFAVRNDGTLDRRTRHCQSSPTWPNNPELRSSHVIRQIPATAEEAR